MRPIDADALLKETIYNPFHAPYIVEKDIREMPTIQPVEIDMNVGDSSKIPNSSTLQLTCNQLATDCISRQQAIDAIENSSKPYVWQGAEIVRNLPPAQPEPQWIPVSERLPEIGKYVLCYLKSRRYFGHYRVCIYRAADKYINHPYFDFNENGFPDVIAWMPLPEPYTK